MTICIKPDTPLRKTGERKQYKISDCGTTNLGTTPPTLGCEAPVIAGLVGGSVRDYHVVKLRGEYQRVSLIKIED